MTTLAITAAVLCAVLVAVRGLWSPCGLSMISTITPLSERARGHRFVVTAGWFVAGSVLGGATLGLVAAGGALVVRWADVGTSVRAALVVTGALVTMASDLHIGGRSLPNHPRQVDETWLGKYRPWVYAGGYGVQIGVGVATYVMTAGVYLLVVVGMLSADPRFALSLGAVFGLMRGLLIFTAARAVTQDRLRRLHRNVDRYEPVSRVVALVGQGAVAVAALTLAPLGWMLVVPASVVVGILVLSMVDRLGRRPSLPAT